MLLRLSLFVWLGLIVDACAGSTASSLAVPNGLRPQNPSAIAIAAAPPSTAQSGPQYRVHAFLEDTAGNMGCLYSGNYEAVKAEADITEFGGSGKGKHPCPKSFDTARHLAGFKLYAYNDIVFVGNSMPISAISPQYYFENAACNAPFVQPSGGSVNPQLAGRQIPNLTDYPKQIAAQVNAYEDGIGADVFFNDNFGDIGTQGINTADLCQAQWSVAGYTAQFPTFLDALNRPQIVNLAGTYDDPYTDGVAASHVFMVASEEGLINFKKNGMFNLSSTLSHLNRLLQLQAAGIAVVLIQYNPAALDASGNPIEFPTGFNTMYDQRLWNYAGGWMVLDYNYFYMETANEGNFTNSGATVEPEYYFVPRRPLKAIAPGSAASLLHGNVLVREFAECYYKAQPIGYCAMVLNPSDSANAIPALTQTYGHSVVISGEGAMPALAGVNGGVSTPADTGTISWRGPRVTSVAAGRAAILTQ